MVKTELSDIDKQEGETLCWRAARLLPNWDCGTAWTDMARGPLRSSGLDVTRLLPSPSLDHRWTWRFFFT